MSDFLFYSNQSDKLVIAAFTPADPEHSLKKKTVNLFSSYLYHTYSVDLDELPMRIPTHLFHPLSLFADAELCAKEIFEKSFT